MSQIFLHVCDGRTLWVPTHQPSPMEAGPVVMLRQVTQAELVRSFYLFDTAVQLIDDPRMSSAYAKTPSDVLSAVGAFRDRCTRDEHFMMSSRYNPSAPRPASAPVQPQIPQVAAPYGGGGYTGGAPMMMGMMPPQHQQYQPQVGYPNNMPPQQYGGGYPQQQHGGPMAPSYGNAPTYGGYGGGGGGNYGGNSGGGGYGQQRQSGGGYGNQQQHQHGGGGGGGSHQQQQQQGSRFQQVVFEKPQPIDVPIEIPKDVWDLYHQPNGRLYCATMPGARITLWLRNHNMTPSNYQRYVHCKSGVSLMMKASAADVLDSKPVELFDRQLCTHFLAHNYCSRQGCLHVHHSETQVRHMIAAKHVLLQDTTKREREQMVEDIIAKDRAAASRPKEDFETRYAIVMAMPPTYVTGTPMDKLRGFAVAEDAKDVQIAPNVVGDGPLRPPPRISRSDNHPRGDEEHGSRRDDQAPPPPAHKPSQRFTGPIGVVSDSDTDSSDTDSSNDSDSDSSSSSSSSSDESHASGKSAGSGKAGDQVNALSEEEQRAAAEARLREKEAKKKLRAMVEKMKDERIGIDKAQKKAFRSITKAADDDHHQIRKREKKERKRQDKDERKRSRADDDEPRSDRRRSRSGSRRRSDRDRR